MSPLPSRVGQKRADWLCNPCTLRGPYTRGQNQKWMPKPCLLGGQKRVKLLCKPYILGGPQTRGQNQKWRSQPHLLGGPKEGTSAIYSLHSWASQKKGHNQRRLPRPCLVRQARRGRYCYATLAFSGIPKQEDEIRSGSLTPAFSRAQKRAVLLCNRCVLRGPQTSGQNQKWLPHPYLLGGPKQSKYGSPACSWIPKQREKKRSGRLTPEATTSVFVPLFGNPREHRGYVAIPPSFGLPRRQG